MRWHAKLTGPAVFLLLGVVAPLFLPGAAMAQVADEQSTRIGGVEVVVWTPTTSTRAALPVVVFSHALYMCPTQSRYRMRALAEEGYLVGISDREAIVRYVIAFLDHHVRQAPAARALQSALPGVSGYWHD
jgi:predicted dienelactone hydrolase